MNDINEQIALFRKCFPDFKTFAQPGEPFLENEDRYKRAMAEFFRKNFGGWVQGNAAAWSVAEFRAHLKALLTEKIPGVGVQNFTNWRNHDVIFNELLKTDEDTQAFMNLLHPLLVAAQQGDVHDPLEGLLNWVQEKHLPNAIQKALVTLLLWLWNSERFIFIKPQIFDRFLKRIGEEPISQMTADEYLRVLRVMTDLEQALQALNPRDMIDLQSFYYIVESDTPDQEGATMRYWKVSHGKDDFTAEQRKTYLEQHTIHVHKDTRKGQGTQFSTVMQDGDLFYLCHGNDDGIRVFGRIMGPAVPSPHGVGWLQRTYDVVFVGVQPHAQYVGVKKGWTPNYNSTCMVVPDAELTLFESVILKPFFGKGLSDIPEWGGASVKPATLPSRNIILYGPPGTGKTWTLRNKYMEHFTESAGAQSKEEFTADLVADLAWWQVIAVAMLELKTTNVSGILEHPLIKARIRRSSNRTPRTGIWAHLQMHTKTDCAAVKYAKRYEPLLFSKDAKSVWSIDMKLAKEEVPDLVEILARYRNFTPGQGARIKRYEFTTFHQSYSYEDFVEGIKPIMSEEVPDTLAYEVKPGIFKTMVQRALADPHHEYALLIDEISRGNVSSIFGELITLIEDDKRQGAPNELCARLPYSRDEFVVPKNLHIIGAMNTADRSVEALDTALRRRFTFVAIPPQPDLIQQPAKLAVDLRKLLGVINARIEKLLDKDHCIGHSYFMGIAESSDPLVELQTVFATKILPLLEEYFYGDPGKIGMVVGERFVSRKDDAIEWAAGDWGMDEFEERHVYALQDPMTLKAEDFRTVYE